MTVTDSQPRGLFSVPVACPLPGLHLSESSPREPSPAPTHLGKTGAQVTLAQHSQQFSSHNVK